MSFLKHILSKMKIFFIFVKKFRDSFQKLKKKLKPRVKFPKTQGKNPKSSKKLKLSEALASAYLQIACYKKKPVLGTRLCLPNNKQKQFRYVHT